MLNKPKLMDYRRFVPAPVTSFNFLTGVDAAITYTRSGSANLYNSSGIITAATANTPRIDYNPTTLAVNGLLLEKAATNLALQSQNWATSWTALNTTSTQAVATAPDGTTTANNITDNSTNGRHDFFQAITIVSATSYVHSCYLKQGTARYAQLIMNGGTTNYGAIFDLQAGVVTSTSTVSTPTGTSNGMQQLPNGWWRCWVTLTSTSTSGFVNVGCSNAAVPTYDGATGNATYAGTGTAFQAWGFQLEVDNGLGVPSSYIPTTTASATRTADKAIITSIPWFNAATGTIVVNGIPAGLNSNNAVYTAAFSDGTTSNSIVSQISTSAKSQGVITVSSSAGTSAGTTTALTANTIFKTALAYNSGANTFYTNGTADGAGTFAASTLPSGISQLNFGMREDGSNAFIGWLRLFNYYNNTFTPTQSAQITT